MATIFIGDYKAQFENLLLDASNGDAAAQFSVAVIYDTGDGVPQDTEEAAFWYRRSADQGNTQAQRCLAEMYTNGEGVPKNEAKALMWNTRAAEAGDASAQNVLGATYENGWGVEKNEETAVHWYRQAAAQGDAMAMNNLGAMYGNGKGKLPCVIYIAYALFYLSVEKGYEAARANLDSAKARLYSQDILASALIYSLRKPGNFLEAIDSANAYVFSNPKKFDLPQDVLPELLKAAEQGDTEAMTELAFMYESGDGVPKNETQASAWYRRAAELGCTSSINFLADSYAEGKGVPQSNVLAYSLYRLMSEPGDELAPISPLRVFLGDVRRKSVEKELTMPERLQAEQLVKELAKPGNFGSAIDAFMAGTFRNK